MKIYHAFNLKDKHFHNHAFQNLAKTLTYSPYSLKITSNRESYYPKSYRVLLKKNIGDKRTNIFVQIF